MLTSSIGEMIMNTYQKKHTLLLSIIIIFIIGGCLPSLSSGFITPTNQGQGTSASSLSLSSQIYNGRLRLYVVEPLSRWHDAEGHSWHFGFLDLAANISLSIPENETDHRTVTWDATQAGFSNVAEDNIMVIAAVFNPIAHQGIIDLPDPYEDEYFDAYYVDAAAAATPGMPGQNIVTDTFTHTVFCEEATGAHCGACPSASVALNAIYESHDYPFYYTSMDADSNDKTLPRLFEYFTAHIIAMPTCFFDGGYQLELGGGEGCEARFRSAIEASGQRDCYRLNLSVSLMWLGSGRIQADVSITNGANPQEPIIEIGTIASQWGGILKGSFITAEIKNSGTAPAVRVPWNISIQGGILKRIHIMNNGTIDMIESGGQKMVATTIPVYGLGNVEIDISAFNEKKKVQGFILGSFLFLQ